MRFHCFSFASSGHRRRLLKHFSQWKKFVWKRQKWLKKVFKKVFLKLESLKYLARRRSVRNSKEIHKSAKINKPSLHIEEKTPRIHLCSIIHPSICSKFSYTRVRFRGGTWRSSVEMLYVIYKRYAIIYFVEIVPVYQITKCYTLSIS